MKRLLLFFSISLTVFCTQTYDSVDSARIPINIKVTVVEPSQQLVVLDETGNQKSSFDLEDDSENFYIQRGATGPVLNISKGRLDMNLENPDLEVKSSSLTTENGITKIGNSILKKSNSSKVSNLSITWEKEEQ
ncbi:MAG: hypothetical protein RR476_02760 [Cetobacterium sp.]|uniref:hypothetical protein n=1 Tax=Cetobacterium sp. TaxID=2071632 RepID=UPI002FCB5632